MKLDHWQRHEPILLDFEKAWQQGTPPSIDEFAGRVAADEAHELLAELVLIDFEHQWNQNRATNLSRYFERYPQLEQPPYRDDLIRQEFRLRGTTGHFPDRAEIESRFSADSTVVELWQQLRSGSATGSEIDVPLQPGAQVNGYQIEACVGRGAFATVYSAMDLTLQRKVALKFLTQSSDLRPEMRWRLLREAQAVAALQHPNVVPVFGTGSFQSHDFIASRLVVGTTLAQLLREQTLSIPNAVEYTCQLASALEHAHQAGIVHRDVKPGNIMIENGVPFLLDFGLALLTDASHQLTQEGDMLGTPAFMSPEQADGRAWSADARSDVYSLGAVLYRMVCGRLPFTGTTTEIISKVLNNEPTRPRDLNADIGVDLQTIILKCLQKEPSQRYQSAADLHQDLRSFQSGLPIQGRPVGPTAQLLMWARRRPGLAGLAAGVIALSLFLLGVGTQLHRVSSQRDRAQVAEQETQSLLAVSAASAGDLALQRGSISAAINHFQQSLDRGHPDQVKILLNLVEAHVAARNIATAAQLWQQADDLADDVRPLPDLAMWQAELALEGVPGIGDGAQLLRNALLGNVSQADRLYANGVLASSSPEAVAALQQSTLLDPFHHRARRLLVFTLLSLARLDEAQQELRIAQQLFPEDMDFRLLDCLRLAASDQLADAEALLERCHLESADAEQWGNFCREVRRVSNDVVLDTGVGQLDMLQLSSIVVKFNADFLPLIQERGWRFPAGVGERFSRLIGTLPELLTGDDQLRAESIEELAAVHPEASLLLMLGSLRLANVDIRAADRDSQIHYVESARDAFRKAMEHPGFLKQDDQFCWKAIFTTSLVLSHSFQHEQQQNSEQLLDAARHIHLETIEQSGQARTFSIMTVTLNELDEASRWTERWLALSQANHESPIDAYWHRAIICQKKEDWIGARRACDEILERNPTHELALALRGTVVANIHGAAEEPVPES